MTCVTLIDFVVGYARGEVLTCLDGLTKAELTVNGKVPQHPVQILGAIRLLHEVVGHHSHPTSAIHVVVTCRQGNIALQLQRDSDEPQEYWVFYPAYYSSAHNELGRIETALFDAY